MDFLDSLKSSSSDYAGGSNNIASMDFENGAMWAYNFLTRWHTPGVDGYPDVDTRVLLNLHKDGGCHIVFGFYRGNDYWVTISGDVIPFGGLSVVGWRYFFDADK
jgi:hypothetical protein|nr:MAG TPA: hypothetical protein [Caudoviricetes sp.]